MSSVTIVSRSSMSHDDGFNQLFSTAPEKLRSGASRVGLALPQLWSSFLSSQLPGPAEFWIATKEGRAAGCIGANLSRSYHDVGYVGFFEVNPGDRAASFVAGSLLASAEEWLTRRGVHTIIGPVNVCTWFQYRFRRRTSDPHDFAWEPTNPPEYIDLLKENGYMEHEWYYTDGLDGLSAVVDQTHSAFERALELGFSFRQFRNDENDLRHLYEISALSFRENYFFETIPFESFRALYVPVSRKNDLSLSHFVVSPDGKEVGYFFCFEDNGYVVYKSVAVLPKMRGLGLSNALVHVVGTRGLERGLRMLITALVRKGAQSESYAKKAQKLWRHDYVLFRKEI